MVEGHGAGKYTLDGAGRKRMSLREIADTKERVSDAPAGLHSLGGAKRSPERLRAGSGCTNSQETYSYNNRMQATEIQLGTSGNAGADYSLGYNYSLPGGTTPPGCPVSAVREREQRQRDWFYALGRGEQHEQPLGACTSMTA